jgi:hypothetical protein
MRKTKIRPQISSYAACTLQNQQHNILSAAQPAAKNGLCCNGSNVMAGGIRSISERECCMEDVSEKQVNGVAGLAPTVIILFSFLRLTKWEQLKPDATVGSRVLPARRTTAHSFTNRFVVKQQHYCHQHHARP